MLKRVLFGIEVAAIVFVSACQATPSLPPSPLTPYSPTVTPFQPVLWTAVPEEFDQQVSPATLTPDALSPDTLSATSLLPDAPFSLYIAPALQSSIYSATQLPEELPLTTDPNASTLKIFVGEDYPVSQWIYALVAPFPTAVDGVSARDLRVAWKGELSGVFDGFPLLMSKSTLGVLSAYWGQPVEGAVRVRAPEKLLKIAWDQQPSWAIVPFEQLHPRWKVLSIDGISPIHKDFDLGDYELAIPISMTGVAPELPQLPPSNRDPEKMTVLAMTGVTALVRATAFTMEQQGEVYPAIDIGPILQAADITHISNEVPFAEDCPYPNPVQEGVRFCSRTKYIELLNLLIQILWNLQAITLRIGGQMPCAIPWNYTTSAAGPTTGAGRTSKKGASR